MRAHSHAEGGLFEGVTAEVSHTQLWGESIPDRDHSVKAEGTAVYSTMEEPGQGGREDTEQDPLALLPDCTTAEEQEKPRNSGSVVSEAQARQPGLES